MTINLNQQGTENNRPIGNPKDKWSAFFLCLIFGWIGAHKFYEGKIFSGLIYLVSTFTSGILTLFSGGFMGILFILIGLSLMVDLLFILCKPNPYYTH